MPKISVHGGPTNAQLDDLQDQEREVQPDEPESLAELGVIRHRYH